MNLKSLKKLRRICGLLWAKARNWITWQEMEEKIDYVLTYAK
ncbi:hypothetical protein ACFL2U_02565 [Patescibacteria group bacterium]